VSSPRRKVVFEALEFIVSGTKENNAINAK
jgi:molybdopterin synthase catalytic subunit